MLKQCYSWNVKILSRGSISLIPLQYSSLSLIKFSFRQNFVSIFWSGFVLGGVHVIKCYHGNCLRDGGCRSDILFILCPSFLFTVRDTFCSYSVMEICTKGLGQSVVSLKVRSSLICSQEKNKGIFWLKDIVKW